MVRHGKQLLWPASLIQRVACARAFAINPEARGSEWRPWLGLAVRPSMLEIDPRRHTSHMEGFGSHSNRPVLESRRLIFDVSAFVLNLYCIFV